MESPSLPQYKTIVHKKFSHNKVTEQKKDRNKIV